MSRSTSVSGILALISLLATPSVAQNRSVLFSPDADSTFAINYAPGSQDVNFFISSPDWYQWTALGFGSQMKDSLMLVAYPAGDNQHITLSPRLATGETEPAYDSSIKVDLHDGSSIQDGMLVVNGTCRSCLSYLDTTSHVQPFIFAVGPSLDLSTDDLTASLRRHVGYAHFTMDMVAAAGTGGIGAPDNITANAAFVGDIYVDSDKKAAAHGILLAIVTLLMVPIDSIVAMLLRRWFVIHIVTSTAVFACVIAGVATGIQVSAEYIKTQKFMTGHQILGLITFVIMVLNFAAGALHGHSVAAARRRDPETATRDTTLGSVHKWTGRFVWLLLLINTGLGLQLSFQKQWMIIGYSVLAAGAVIFVIPLAFCLWRLRKKDTAPKEEDGHELSNYNMYENH